MENNLYSLAILIPCYNEEKTIAKVVRDFRSSFPQASIFVFDNNSTDSSTVLAMEAGATVIKEKRQGKGFVVGSMLQMVEADYYIMVDGDDTYPVEYADALLQPLLNQEADMVVGHRLSDYTDNAFRPLHVWGNKLVCNLINLIFSSHLSDPMSGYRAFTREVALHLPIVASGFDVETEMTLQLLYRHFVIKEIQIPYRSRPEGSFSKLRTFRDGGRVVWKILNIFSAYKPLTFFGGISLVFLFISLLSGSFVIREYILYRYIYSVPKTILAGSCFTIFMLLISIGLILHTLNFRLLEITSALSKQILRAKENT